MKEITVGEVRGEPGKIVCGFWNAFEHPIGTIERLPVIIAQGLEEGPVLWLTANIHGDEYTGIPVIHSVINQVDVTQLKGAIVAIPTLNPAGSRITARYPYYDKKDPNRLFPDGNPFKEMDNTKQALSERKVIKKDQTEEDAISLVSEKEISIALEGKEDESTDPLAKFEREELYPSIQEIIWQKLFAEIKKSAEVLIDLHNAYIKSIPFIFLDRVLYNPQKGEVAEQEAKALLERTMELVSAFGFTIIRETTPAKYVLKKLHRSTSGAALNTLHIPAFTVELGMYREVEEDVVKAAVKGVFNLMKKMGLLKGEPEAITEVPVVARGEAVRYVGHPRAKSAAIIELRVTKGAKVQKGDIIAYARDIFGRPKKDEYEIRTEIDGYVFMINEGILRYPNEEICWIAAEDTQPLIEKWPKKR